MLIAGPRHLWAVLDEYVPHFHLDPGPAQHRVERLGELPGPVPEQDRTVRTQRSE